MRGLQRLCKLHGSIVIQGTTWVWDYAEDKAVLESEMPQKSERHKASEKAKWTALKEASEKID